MKNACVIGAGTMGNGICHTFALHDFRVTLIDIDSGKLEMALQTISSNLKRQVKKEVISSLEADECLSNIQTSTSIESSVTNADIVIEAVTENLNIKQKIFKLLSDHCTPECILASNTSSISINQLAENVTNPERVIGMHFMNPVPVMVLVEVIKSKLTSEKTTNTVRSICVKLKKEAIAVNDAPGFIANRILMPMINEAILALEEGVAGVEEIDKIMTLGMAHPMGPLLLADLIGLDVCLSIINVLHKEFNDKKYQPGQLLVSLVNENQLGRKTKKGFYDYSNQYVKSPVPFLF